MSVVDASRTDSAETSFSINPYLFIGSEINNNINYDMMDLCDTTFQSKRKIDLVLMTQGWRNYLWNSIRYRSTLSVTYPAEKGFYLDGNMSVFNSHKSLGNYKLTFFDTKAGYNDMIDVRKDGKFVLDLPPFYGNHTLVIQNKNKRNNIDDARFSMDLIGAPEIELKNNELPYSLINQGYFNAMKEKFSHVDTSQLVSLKRYAIPEIVVKAKNRPFYSKPDKIVNLDKTDPTGKKYRSLMGMIAAEFGDKAFMDSKGRRCSPILLVNGVQYDIQFTTNEPPPSSTPDGRLVFLPNLKSREYNKIMTIPVNEISNVKFYSAGSDYSQFLTPAYPMDSYISASRGSSLSGEFNLPSMGATTGRTWNRLSPATPLMRAAWGALPIVSFTTYYNFYRGDPVGTIKIPFEGLYQAREFYHPSYEKNRSSKSDNRATIYWNPEVNTDSTGIAKISFYNSDLKGKAIIRVKGVSYKLHDAASATAEYFSK
jgi:hypothetical protein